MTKQSTALFRLERQTRALLAKVASLDLDSARTSFAQGHLDQAASDLRQAAIARRAVERHEGGN